MQESMTRGEWWDESAPYGPNGYTYGRGERIAGAQVAREVTFDMQPGDPNCVARGVAEMTDGRVYMFTVVREEFARNCPADGRKRRRFASLSRQPFREAASELMAWEIAGHRIRPADAPEYMRKINSL